jgi:hypothetical protein
MAARRLAGSGQYATASTTATSGEWTIIAYGYMRAFGASAIATSAEAPGDATYDRSLSTTAGDAVTAYVFDGGSKTVTTTGTTVAGVPFFAAARCTTSSLSAMLNQEIVSTSVANSGYTGYSSAEFVCGYGGGSSPTLSSAFSAAYILKIERALSFAELRRLAANPWLVVEPRASRIFLSAPAASGSTGTLARTNANDTSAASGTTTVVGSLARTNAADTSAASGTTTVVGSLARTNAADTSSAAGTTTVVGTLARTNAADTSSAAGTTTVVGTVAVVNASDTVAATGFIPATGTVAVTNADDTASASGAAGDPTVRDLGAGGRRRRLYAGTPSKRRTADDPPEAAAPQPAPEPAPIAPTPAPVATTAEAQRQAGAPAEPQAAAPAIQFAAPLPLQIDAAAVAQQIAAIEQRHAQEMRRRRIERNNRAAAAAAELLLLND